MAPSVSLLYILFTIGFLSKCSTGVPQLELGLQFLEEPGDVIGIRGKSLSLPCKAKTTLQKDLFHVVWYHDNKQMDLRNDKRRIVFQNGTLYFLKLVHKRTGHSDQGNYRCVVVRENGSLSSKPGFLRISGLPENFSRHPVTQTADLGSNVRMACEMEYRPDIEIVWEKDEQIISQNEKKYATISGPDIRGSILYIFNVLSSDSGNYRCTARNIFSNKLRHSSNGRLTVLHPEHSSDFQPITFLSAQESFVPFSTNVREIREGDNVTLDCVANIYAILISGWTFLEHGQNTSQSIYNFTNTGYNIIHLKNVTRRQAGLYTCSGMDLSNNSRKELKTHLKVMVAPEIQEKSDNIVFRTSKTVRFRCVIYGNPIPEVYWLKDGNLFNITGRIKHRTSVNDSLQVRISELIVSSTVASDAGIYQCMAQNSVGWSWAASRLLLNATKPAPGAPERVSCEPVSSSQIKLTWDVSNSSKKIKAFSIHYHLTDDGEEMQKVMQSDSRSIQIEKLLPFSNYTFYLRLYMDSASEFSEKAVCQTKEEAPTEAPKKKLQIISPNSVHVSWVPLEKKKARGIINKYKVQWRCSKSLSSRAVEVTGNILNYTITGLVPGKKYDLRVLAATSKGWPDYDLPWETFEIPVNFNFNIPSPPKVSSQALNSSGVEIRWRVPDRGTKIIGYKIFYRKQNSSQIGPIIVPPDTNNYIVAGLEPETWYEFTVSGFTQEDDGESGVSFIHTLSGKGSSNKITSEFSSVPEPPVSLEADPVSPVAINLTWSTPQAPPGFNNIKHYTVCFNPVQTNRSKNITNNCVKSLENKISIAGLNPYTLYEFQVRSHDFNDKQSVFSQAMECHTLEDVPSQVLDINWKAINKTAVQISWKQPRNINGILQSYTLFYTNDSNLPLEFWNIKIVSAGNCETQLTDLSSDVKYYLIIRASTSAGLGSYAAPKQIYIASNTTLKNNHSNHYLGIIGGLGIGFFCIIICTTCILCRRSCLKRQITQEIEVTSGRQSNGNVCRRDREFVTESRETEYFTFLSSSRDQSNSLQIAGRHIDSKGNYPNGAANGIKMSLLGESKALHNDSGKANIYVNKNSKSDQNNLELQLLNSETNFISLHRDANCHLSKFNNSEYYNELKTPLLNGKPKCVEPDVFNAENDKESESRLYAKVQTTSLSSSEYNETSPENVNSNLEQSIEDENWSNVNSILQNPEFRFSNSNSNDIVKRNCGYLRQSYLYNGLSESNNINGNEVIRYYLDYGDYKNSKLSLHFVSKEIIQES